MAPSTILLHLPEHTRLSCPFIWPARTAPAAYIAHRWRGCRPPPRRLETVAAGRRPSSVKRIHSYPHAYGCSPPLISFCARPTPATQAGCLLQPPHTCTRVPTDHLPLQLALARAARAPFICTCTQGAPQLLRRTPTLSSTHAHVPIRCTSRPLLPHHTYVVARTSPRALLGLGALALRCFLAFSGIGHWVQPLPLQSISLEAQGPAQGPGPRAQAHLRH